jgi:hypothetical protein
VDQVFVRYVKRTAPELQTPDVAREMEEEVPEPWLELGYRYQSRALTTKALDSVVESPGASVARAGSMAHHILINATSSQKRGGKGPIPIADLLGDAFVLLVGHEGTGWVTAARTLITKEVQWMPELAVHQLAEGEGNGRFYEKYAILPSGCVLIRPDGFVAWSERGARASDSEVKLKSVLRQILCLGVPMNEGGLARL